MRTPDPIASTTPTLEGKAQSVYVSKELDLHSRAILGRLAV